MPLHSSSFERYTTYLRQVLTPERLKHSLGVMQVMGELAEIYALDRDKALTVGLLHDAAKDMSPADYGPMIKEAKIVIGDPCEAEYVFYLHGPVGAYVVHKQLGVTDPLILNAIYNHTWCGKESTIISPTTWALRFADLLEPNRNWQNVPLIGEKEPTLRELVYAGRMQEAALFETDMLIKFMRAIGQPVHPHYYRVYNDLLQTFVIPPQKM
jgi:predicted HD superfamily hydrolase involved in NAD metabolism